tara:strand:- start:366 stop:737 length:372 start_codon:yes stop_codon:yes gene_type:complete
MNKQEIFQEMNKCINWFINEWGVNGDDDIFITEIMELTYVCINDIIEIECYQSGGGCLHYFIRLNTKQIISIHQWSEGQVISFTKWESIDDYIFYDQDEKQKDIGFGYEPYDDDFDLRTIELY